MEDNRIWEVKHPKRYNDKSLVDNWLDINDYWFTTPTNTFFGKREMFRALAEYWLKNGEHGEDYNDPAIIRGQSYWDDYIELFNEIEK